mgnify:CR=1 FL=1
MHDDSRKVELPRRRKPEKPIPSVYPVLDTDLARDNVENDIPAADLELSLIHISEPTRH